jgi:hypothetical protein
VRARIYFITILMAFNVVKVTNIYVSEYHVSLEFLSLQEYAKIMILKTENVIDSELILL